MKSLNDLDPLVIPLLENLHLGHETPQPNYVKRAPAKLAPGFSADSLGRLTFAPSYINPQDRYPGKTPPKPEEFPIGSLRHWRAGGIYKITRPDAGHERFVPGGLALQKIDTGDIYYTSENSVRDFSKPVDSPSPKPRRWINKETSEIITEILEHKVINTDRILCIRASGANTVYPWFDLASNFLEIE